MQKKIAKNKVDSKDKKAPRKGASRESIFNYDIEVTEEMDKKREEKKLRLQKQREKEQKMPDPISCENEVRSVGTIGAEQIQ